MANRSPYVIAKNNEDIVVVGQIKSFAGERFCIVFRRFATEANLSNHGIKNQPRQSAIRANISWYFANRPGECAVDAIVAVRAIFFFFLIAKNRVSFSLRCTRENLTINTDIKHAKITGYALRVYSERVSVCLLKRIMELQCPKAYKKSSIFHSAIQRMF